MEGVTSIWPPSDLHLTSILRQSSGNWNWNWNVLLQQLTIDNFGWNYENIEGWNYDPICTTRGFEVLLMIWNSIYPVCQIELWGIKKEYNIEFAGSLSYTTFSYTFFVRMFRFIRFELQVHVSIRQVKFGS